MRRVNAVLSGLGNIGSRFVGVLDRKRDVLRDKYDLDVRLVAAADVNGGAIAPEGLDLGRVAQLKGQSIGTIGDPSLGILDILQQVNADVFFEATPVNLQTGEPGLSAIRTALKRGMHVITPNNLVVCPLLILDSVILPDQPFSKLKRRPISPTAISCTRWAVAWPIEMLYTRHKNKAAVPLTKRWMWKAGMRSLSWSFWQIPYWVWMRESMM